MNDPELSAAQHEMLKTWTQHLDAEFRAVERCGGRVSDRAFPVTGANQSSPSHCS